MPDKRITDGKVTYIHGATPKERLTPLGTPVGDYDAAREAFDRLEMTMAPPRTTLEQLEAGEQDISQHAYEFPPEGLHRRPDEPSVQVYYGAPANGSMADSEPDELDIWAPDTNQSVDDAELVEWRVIVSVFTILTLIIAAIAGIVYFAQFYDFSDFPGTFLNPPGSTPK